MGRVYCVKLSVLMREWRVLRASLQNWGKVSDVKGLMC